MKISNLLIVAKLLVAVVLAIKAKMPYGVSSSTIFTIRMMIARNACMPRAKVTATSAFSFLICKKAIPTKIEKITTAIVLVERIPAKSAKIFCCGKVKPFNCS